MTYAKFHSMGTCPPPPPMTPAQQGAKAAELAKAVGATACQRSSATERSETQGHAGIDLGFLGKAGVSVGNVTTSQSQTAIGCEQLIAISDTYNKAVSNISCSLSKNQYTSTKTLTTGNTITFEAGKDLNVNCPVLKIDQGINVKFVSLEQLTESEKTSMANEITDVIKKTDEALQEQKLGVGAMGDGSKIIKDTAVDIQQQDYKLVVNEVIKEMDLKVDSKNNITFRAGGNLNITGDQCILTQNIVLDIVAQNIVSSTLDKIFSGKISNELVQESKTGQTAEVKGLEEIAKFSDLSNPVFSSSGSSLFKIIIVIVIVLIMLGIGMYFLSGGGDGSAAGLPPNGYGLAPRFPTYPPGGYGVPLAPPPSIQ